MNILYIGASGTLGSKLVPMLRKLHNVDTPNHHVFNISDSSSIEFKHLLGTADIYDLIILSAGDKDQGKIETYGWSALLNNIIGVSNLVRDYWKIPIVYISTGYVYKGNKRYNKEDDGLYPCNRYAWSKLGGECVVRMLPEDSYLIVRCEFSQRPWHTNYGFIDQHTSREEVSIIAEKIFKLIALGARGTFNIGGKRKSVWQYAQSIADTKIFKCKVKDYATVPLPKDSSLNTSKYDKFMEDKDAKAT